MRVGVIGPIFPDSMADNILHALADMGVESVALGGFGIAPGRRWGRQLMHVLRTVSSEGERLTQRGVIRRAAEASCDVVINLEQSLLPEAVKELQNQGRSKVALWFPDAVSNIGRSTMFAAPYDVLFLKDPLMTDRIRDTTGLPAMYLPEACNPRWHRPISKAGVTRHIAVVGNIYPTRAALLQRLANEGIPLRLYGSPFPRWFDPGPLADLHAGRVVFREDKARVFREASGVLNNLHPAEMSSVNCRLFEATASGGAVICERRPALKSLFVEGEEVLGFDSFSELVSHCRELLDSQRLVGALGDAASKRAHAEHSYEDRLNVMLEILA